MMGLQRIKFIFLTQALLMSVSFSLSAEEPSVLCKNPVAGICTNNNYQKEREENLEKIKKQIKQDAEKEADKKIAEMKKSTSALNVVGRAYKASKIKNEEMMKAAKKHLGELDTITSNSGQVKLIKDYTKEAIDQSTFPIEVKEKFKATIDTVIVGNYAEFLEQINNKEIMAEASSIGACGPDGLNNNAFSFNVWVGKTMRPYLLVCPGFLINLKFIKNQQERFESMMRVLVHEITHAIDSGKFKDYGNFIDCLAKHKADQLEMRLSPILYPNCSRKNPNTPECKRDLVLTHSRELIADEWAYKTMALYASKTKMSVDSLNKILTYTFAISCTSTDDGSHPSGSYRIKAAINNPGMFDALNCDRKRNQVVCTIDEGETSL